MFPMFVLVLSSAGPFVEVGLDLGPEVMPEPSCGICLSLEGDHSAETCGACHDELHMELIFGMSSGNQVYCGVCLHHLICPDRITELYPDVVKPTHEWAFAALG